MIESQFEQFDKHGAVRPTLLVAKGPWLKKHYQGLLSDQEEKTLYDSDIEASKNKAFDLLDALSKSGATIIEDTALHVIIASSHNFEKTIMDVLVQDNVNPIEKLEHSSIIMTAALHGVPKGNVISPEYRDAILKHAPQLIESE